MINPKDNFENDNQTFMNDNIEEYFLIKEKSVYKFNIIKGINEIIIKYKNYIIQFNNNDLSILTNSLFNTIDDAYEFIINIFEQNKVYIKDININKDIKLIFKIYIDKIEKDIEIILLYNKLKEKKVNNNSNNDIKDEIIKLKNEIKILKKEINELKLNQNKSNNQIINKNLNFSNDDKNKIENFSNPQNIELLRTVVKDSYTNYLIDNQFSIFKSINNILFLIYTNKNRDIIFFDLINNKKISEIKNAHNNNITNFRYYYDSINKIDIILSISCKDNNIKLWNVNNLECLLNLKNIYNNGEMDSACFLNNNNQNYIITSNFSNKNNPIKVFDFKGNKIKEINNSNDKTYIIDIYYDKKLFKNFIITGNLGNVKSYDYNENKIYHKYSDSNNSAYFSIIINDKDNIIKLIGSNTSGFILIWNFHSGKLLNKIKVINKGLYGVCLWNSDFLFVGCYDHSIKLIDLNKGKIIKSFDGHNKAVITIKKIICPEYGECLITQGLNDIILWKNNI